MTAYIITPEQHAQIVDALEAVEPQCGYGFYRPANPHDFQPDHESCSEQEIAAHRAACEAYTKGEYVPAEEGGWVTPKLHLSTAPWGIGTYQVVDQRITSALAMLKAMKPVEPVGYLSRCSRFYKTRMMAVENFEQVAEPVYAKEQQ